MWIFRLSLVAVFFFSRAPLNVTTHSVKPNTKVRVKSFLSTKPEQRAEIMNLFHVDHSSSSSWSSWGQRSAPRRPKYNYLNKSLIFLLYIFRKSLKLIFLSWSCCFETKFLIFCILVFYSYLFLFIYFISCCNFTEKLVLIHKIQLLCGTFMCQVKHYIQK